MASEPPTPESRRTPRWAIALGATRHLVVRRLGTFLCVAILLGAAVHLVVIIATARALASNTALMRPQPASEWRRTLISSGGRSFYVVRRRVPGGALFAIAEVQRTTLTPSAYSPEFSLPEFYFKALNGSSGAKPSGALSDMPTGWGMGVDSEIPEGGITPSELRIVQREAPAKAGYGEVLILGWPVPSAYVSLEVDVDLMTGSLASPRVRGLYVPAPRPSKDPNDPQALLGYVPLNFALFGTMVDIGVWAVCAAVIAPCVIFVAYLVRSSRDRCIRCGYSLAGIAAGVCPECGARAHG